MADIPTAQEIKDFLEGYCEIDNVISDAWLEARRDNFVIPWIEEKTRIPLTQISTITEYLDGRGQNILTLDRRNIVDLVKVEYVTAGDYQVELDNTTFIPVKEQGIIKAIRTESVLTSSRTVFPKGKKNIKVTYTIGYDTGELPASLKEAIIYGTAEKALALLASRTGGGSSSVCGKTYGNRGKYTDVRNELGRMFHSIVNDLFVSTVGD